MQLCCHLVARWRLAVSFQSWEKSVDRPCVSSHPVNSDLKCEKSAWQNFPLTETTLTAHFADLSSVSLGKNFNLLYGHEFSQLPKGQEETTLPRTHMFFKNWHCCCFSDKSLKKIYSFISLFLHEGQFLHRERRNRQVFHPFTPQTAARARAELI